MEFSVMELHFISIKIADLRPTQFKMWSNKEGQKTFQKGMAFLMIEKVGNTVV